ncbi:MAG: hypothetical protein R3F14_22225 [Polyangiaceae bacterium]
MTDSPTAKAPSGDLPSPAAGADEDTAPRGLPRAMFAGILAIVVTIFLLARGPVWRDPWNAGHFDSAIFWSYLPIPFLVGGGLLLVRRFSLRFLFLESLAITVLKYGITFAIAIALWASTSPPPKPAAPPPPPPKPAAPPAPPPEPTPIAPGSTGVVRGTVTGPDGAPVAGALIHIATGLEAFVFARPTAPVRVENDGATVHMLPDDGAPAFPVGLVVARAGQTITGRSLDGHLHTLVASGGSSGTTFNIPMMSSGAWSTVVVREPARTSRLRCTVHPNAERDASITIIDHPFFAATGPDGAFRFEGVPAAALTLAAWHSTLGEATSPAAVTAGQSTSADLRLAPAP